MTLIRLNSNKTLKGHKAVLLGTVALPEASVQAIRDQFPDLNIIQRVVPWGSKEVGGDFSEDEWKDTTLLLTSTVLPTIEKAPHIQYVQLSSAGANHILSHPYFSETQIPFSTANGVHGPQISEWIIATFLSFQHNLTTYYEYQKEENWQGVNANPKPKPVDDAVAQRVGILGYGSIGRQTARLAKALGMEVHAYTLHPRPTPESRKDYSYIPSGLGDPDGVLPSKWFSGGSKEEIHEFLGSGLDLLVIATPLTDQTKGLISKAEFEVLAAKKTFVTNISRGPVVNTEDLIEALNNDVIRGAALDVTDPEPLPAGHPLWKAKNITITPHISASSRAYFVRLLEIFQINLQRITEGRPLINTVNRKNGY